MPYRKRRVLKSPNKNAERSQRNQTSSPPLKTYFPDVERLVLDLQFVNRQGHLLQEDHFEYGPSDPVTFLVPCPGGCGDGETDLQSKIQLVVRQHQTNGEGQAQCSRQLYSNTELCGCKVQCQISVTYRPGAEEEA